MHVELVSHFMVAVCDVSLFGSCFHILCIPSVLVSVCVCVYISTTLVTS